jgi:hypothetical protein
VSQQLPLLLPPLLLLLPLLRVLCYAVGVDGQGLAAFLVNEAYARQPLDITFHWHAQPEAFDLQGRSLRCKTSNRHEAYAAHHNAKQTHGQCD